MNNKLGNSSCERQVDNDRSRTIIYNLYAYILGHSSCTLSSSLSNHSSDLLFHPYAQCREGTLSPDSSYQRSEEGTMKGLDWLFR